MQKVVMMEILLMGMDVRVHVLLKLVGYANMETHIMKMFVQLFVEMD